MNILSKLFIKKVPNISDINLFHKYLKIQYLLFIISTVNCITMSSNEIHVHQFLKILIELNNLLHYYTQSEKSLKLYLRTKRTIVF